MICADFNGDFANKFKNSSIYENFVQILIFSNIWCILSFTKRMDYAIMIV